MHYHFQIAESNFDNIFTTTNVFCTAFLWFYVVIQHFLISIQRALFSISWKAGLVVINFLSFCLFRNVFIPPLFLKDSIPKYIIINWQVFFLSIFWMCHLIVFWPEKLLMINLQTILWGFPHKFSKENLLLIPFAVFKIVSWGNWSRWQSKRTWTSHPHMNTSNI